LAEGHRVTIFDSLLRPGSERNLAWLKSQHSDRLTVIQGDVRDASAMEAAVCDVDVIYHIAGQVAVTSSVTDPRTDFDINALGTFNVLEAARKNGRDPVVVFTSTNKVYGGMEDVEVVERATRYEYVNLSHGTSESRPLDFHSPYGCSKGAADQYVRDYARIFGLRTVVFRMSCIYGPRQYGNEDQGWLAHFLIAARGDQPITIYGDGKQVRDILFIDDLVRALRLAAERIDVTAGRIYNIGGGPTNTISVWAEFGEVLAALTGKDVEVTFGPWRAGDQLCYVSDTRAAQADMGWRPQVDRESGIELLAHWIASGRTDVVGGPQPALTT
jgi:CDP-paratose 2-epimerase